MKFLIFHISKAWKTDPFRVKPSCIGNYREYPPVLYSVRVLHTQKKKNSHRPYFFIPYGHSLSLSASFELSLINAKQKKTELIFNKALKHKICKLKEMEIWVFPMESHHAKKI